MSDRRLEAVLWDLDGVIADTADCHYQAWRDVFGKRGVEFNRQDFMRFFGRRHDAIIKFALGRLPPPREFEAITEEKQENYRHRVSRDMKALPGAIELLKSLRENGIKSAIASSAPMENINIILNGLDIEGYFDAIASGTTVPEGKPSPQVFLLAAEKLNVDPADCVVIEDAIAGVSAARRAGMKYLVVDTLDKVDARELERLFD
jgi:beta-phosphoglucomutase family hydrolase